MRNILFEDHTLSHFRPVAWSLPTYELRCGLFNTRERVELLDSDGDGWVLSREVLAPLHTAPRWTEPADQLSERSLWFNGRLAPRAALISRLLELRNEDWALVDEHGLLAASLPPDTATALLAAWRAWQKQAWAGKIWSLPEIVTGLPGPDLTGLEGERALGWIWDLVPATSGAISADLELVGEGTSYQRHLFGIYGADDATWSQPGSLRRVAEDNTPELVHISGSGGLYLGQGGVDLAPGTHIDTTGGPVVLDSGVSVAPHVYLAGPLYIGRNSRIKPGACIFGESSFGVGNRLAGEIGESTFGDFANKQHDGFVGHAVLGSWVNLGAMTTCSDLKNNYGPVRVDLGDGQQDTGLRFVGLLMGDHAKTAIGSLFNTGTSVGFASNIFGVGMPPKYVPNFSWGGQDGAPGYDCERAQQTAAVVMERRQCRWTEDHAPLFALLHQISQD